MNPPRIILPCKHAHRWVTMGIGGGPTRVHRHLRCSVCGASRTETQEFDRPQWQPPRIIL